MSEAPTFTPGPWCIEDPMAPESVWIVQAGKETYEWWPIAVCNMPDEEDHLFTGAEVHANARLIAAAPDMYEALRLIASQSPHDHTTREDPGREHYLRSVLISIASRALAEATGSMRTAASPTPGTTQHD